MQLLFIDESGDHSLEKIDESYPVFLLAGVLIDKDYYNEEVIKQFEKLKKDIFGTSKIILHSSDIARNRNGFEKLKNPKNRKTFYNELNDLISNLEFGIISCAIDKKKFRKLNLELKFDPYELSLRRLIEIYCMRLNKESDCGNIYAEKRSKLLDESLMLSWKLIKNNGLHKLKGEDITTKIKEFKLVGKKENNIGLQIADLVASPIARNIIGKKNNKDFMIIKKKKFNIEVIP